MSWHIKIFATFGNEGEPLGLQGMDVQEMRRIREEEGIQLRDGK